MSHRNEQFADSKPSKRGLWVARAATGAMFGALIISAQEKNIVYIGPVLQQDGRTTPGVLGPLPSRRTTTERLPDNPADLRAVVTAALEEPICANASLEFEGKKYGICLDEDTVSVGPEGTGSASVVMRTEPEIPQERGNISIYNSLKAVPDLCNEIKTELAEPLDVRVSGVIGSTAMEDVHIFVRVDADARLESCGE